MGDVKWEDGKSIIGRKLKIGSKSTSGGVWKWYTMSSKEIRDNGD